MNVKRKVCWKIEAKVKKKGFFSWQAPLTKNAGI